MFCYLTTKYKMCNYFLYTTLVSQLFPNNPRIYTAVFEGVLSGYCYPEVQKKYYNLEVQEMYRKCTTVFLYEKSTRKVPLISGAKNVQGFIVQDMYLFGTDASKYKFCTNQVHFLSGTPKVPLQQEAHVGHCHSPEYNERVKNVTSEWNQKQQSFIPHASRSLLCIRFVAVAFWAKKQFFLRWGPP